MWQKGYDSMEKVGVSQEEKQLSYYKYFEQDLAPIPLKSSPSLRRDLRKRKKRFRLNRKTCFLQGGMRSTARPDTV